MKTKMVADAYIYFNSINLLNTWFTFSQANDPFCHVPRFSSIFFFSREIRYSAVYN